MARLITIKKRADFLRAARGRRWGTGNFLVQVRRRGDTADAPARFGFTVTKKLGNAAVRNRIRRRLKAAARELQGAGAPGHDYVLIARGGAVKAPFHTLRDEIARAARLTEKAGAR